jgi:hypothetical protein|tara:strand:- start:150 stop:1655 length:1506 start_codon:yes stop_codon:yes gene_type:complete
MAMIGVTFTEDMAAQNYELFDLVESNSLAAVEAMLVDGADVNSSAALTGYTALMKAADRGFADMVALLIRFGADVDRVSRQVGYTALIDASLKGFSDVVSILLDAGADRDAILNNSPWPTALDLAKENGHDNVISEFRRRTCVECYAANPARRISPRRLEISAAFRLCDGCNTFACVACADGLSHTLRCAKEKGNAFFKRSELARAKEAYAVGIDAVDETAAEERMSIAFCRPATPHHVCTAIVSLISNMSMCALKAANYSGAMKFAASALSHEIAFQNARDGHPCLSLAYIASGKDKLPALVQKCSRRYAIARRTIAPIRALARCQSALCVGGVAATAGELLYLTALDSARVGRAINDDVLMLLRYDLLGEPVPSENKEALAMLRRPFIGSTMSESVLKPRAARLLVCRNGTSIAMRVPLDVLRSVIVPMLTPTYAEAMREWKTGAQRKRLLREAEDERYVLIGNTQQGPLYKRLFAAMAKAKKGKVKSRKKKGKRRGKR